MAGDTWRVLERWFSREERYHVLVIPDATIVMQLMKTSGFLTACPSSEASGKVVTSASSLNDRVESIARKSPLQPIERRRPVQPAARKMNPPENNKLVKQIE